MEFEANLKSLRKHKVPDWFHDAKFGIFIHWSLSAVPAYADVDQGDFVELQKKEGIGAQFFQNPYSEWYLNSLRIESTQTNKYHKEKYGENFSYDNFASEFNEKIKNWNPSEWAELFKEAGAKYIVLVTKHHDGFLLWPSDFPNPKKQNYHASRDIVGELTDAVKSKDMKMGFYYSGALDWSFTEKPIVDLISLIDNGPIDQEYADYVDFHWHELIDRYDPIILWNDIGYPPKGKMYELFAYFYNKHEDGVVNDRWMKFSKTLRKLVKFWPIKKFVNWLVNREIEKGAVSTIEPPHYDYQTPEYTTFGEIREKKWECVRGIGHSFGYNQFEPESQYLTLEELVHMFIDIVSKNGNLLLNVGPMADGTIPTIQRTLLNDFGKWMKVNGEAIYSTRPWKIAEAKTKNSINIRFTTKGNNLYMFLLDAQLEKEIIEINVDIDEVQEIILLSKDDNKSLEWSKKDSKLKIKLPETIETQPAHVLKIILNP